MKQLNSNAVGGLKWVAEKILKDCFAALAMTALWQMGLIDAMNEYQLLITNDHKVDELIICIR